MDADAEGDEEEFAVIVFAENTGAVVPWTAAEFNKLSNDRDGGGGIGMDDEEAEEEIGIGKRCPGKNDGGCCDCECC